MIYSGNYLELDSLGPAPPKLESNVFRNVWQIRLKLLIYATSSHDLHL